MLCKCDIYIISVGLLRRQSCFLVSGWVLKVTQLLLGRLTVMSGLLLKVFLCLALLCSQMSHSRDMFPDAALQDGVWFP